jgi:hypothetical protein
MKSIIFNSDLFTKILTQNLKDKNNSALNMMSLILQKATLPDINRIIETSPNINNVDLNLLENKYKSFNLTSILIDNNLSEILNKILYNVLSRTRTSTGASAGSDFNFDAEAAEAAKTAQAINFNLKKNYVKIYDIIFNSINYKNLGGIRLEVKGRLTKRNRADRALFKVK